MTREINPKDVLQEECGVFGIYAPGQPVAELTYLGLLALQHRGQDGAGIAVGNLSGITVVKNIGLVDRALDGGQVLSSLPPGNFASGHVLYSTNPTNNYEDNFRATQPMLAQAAGRSFTLAHNGHIINVDELENHDALPKPVTDSELVTRLVASELEAGHTLNKAVARAGNRLIGAFTLVIMGQDELIGVRDPHGFRPLMLGSLPDGGKVLASELAALQIVKARFDREIEPGELVRIDSDGRLQSSDAFDTNPAKPSLCAFEYVYFSRPDNELLGENVEQTRFRAGQLLARQAPVRADIVVGVPNSGMSAAHGYADVSKIPIQLGLTKNNYIGRLFITAGQLEREQVARIKLGANRGIVKGLDLAVVDDSLIRKTTIKETVAILREADAASIHLLIASPPYKWPCFYGMNTGDINELIAATNEIEQIRQEVGADSLSYLTVDGLKASLGKAASKVCMACMTGNYPTPVPPELLLPK